MDGKSIFVHGNTDVKTGEYVETDFLNNPDLKKNYVIGKDTDLKFQYFKKSEF